MKITKQKFFLIPKIICLSLIFSAGLGLALAWNGPAATPPSSNKTAPLNTSNDWQTKYGYLSLPKLYDSNDGQTGYYLDPGANSWLYRLYSYDIRSSIFYDRDNTGYYVDPASTSKFNTINLGGVSKSSWPSGGIGSCSDCDSRFINVGESGDSIADNTIDSSEIQDNTLTASDLAANSVGNSEMIDNPSFTIMYDANNTGYYVNPNSNSWLYRLYSYDVRADIYYDRNNTSYYLNPASTSYLNDVRASIVYDRDNTSYYSNPAGTSKFNTINLGGESRSSWPSGGSWSDGGSYIYYDSGTINTRIGQNIHTIEGSVMDGMRITYGSSELLFGSLGSGIAGIAFGTKDNMVSLFKEGNDRAYLRTYYGDDLIFDNCGAGSCQTNMMIKGNSGTVGIGTINPYTSYDVKLDVNGRIRYKTGGHTVAQSGVYTGTNKYLEYYIDDSSAWGVTMWASSERFKENIAELELDSSKIYDLRPVSFNWKEDRGGGRDFGLIAEEVEKIEPLLVSYEDDGTPFFVRYEMLSVLNLNELQKLKVENDALKELVCLDHPNAEICH